MIEFSVPGFKDFRLKTLIIDYNGTLAEDGVLIEGITGKLNMLAKKLKIIVLTSDTYGNAATQLKNIDCELRIISGQNQDYTKMQTVKQFDSSGIVAVGNGRNDAMMLAEASLSIAVIQKEGAAVAALQNADIVVFSVSNAIDLLLNPLRIIATLRS